MGMGRDQAGASEVPQTLVNDNTDWATPGQILAYSRAILSSVR
jgi:hypothetical protein